MAEDARTQFVDGLRVSAEHLQHLQDRLRESVLDVRNAIGLGRVAWGLRATLGGSNVDITPGVAFASGGVRLAVDSPLSIAVPAGPDATLAVVLRAVHGDRDELRFNGVPTVITLETHAEVVAPPAADPDAMVVATVTRNGGVLSLTQDDAVFVAAGTHGHTGTHVQDADGRWHYDGVAIAGGQAGPAGPQGAQGPAGAAGPAGAQGIQGDVGPAGAAGPPGPTGADGPVGGPGLNGLQGPSGPDGPAGPTGPVGPAGPVGNTGPQGPPGTAAAQGDPGPPGIPGPQGPQGNPGTIGPVGPPGANGPVGLPGPQGAPGVDGAIGPPGAAGAAGPPGPQGLPGTPGIDGAVGPLGPAGAPGLPGAVGAQGADGIPGAAGPPGPTGPVGAVGPVGPPGQAGPVGPGGAVGPIGPVGLSGQNGAVGPVGPVGPPGQNGAPGAAGPAGPVGPGGPAGQDGAVGPAGPVGAPGPAGADGASLDEDWGVIRKINWPHDQKIKVGPATQLLQGGLQVNLSKSVDQTIQAVPPSVVEVWFQPDPSGNPTGQDVPLPIVSLFGTLRITPQTITWIPSTSDAGFKATMRQGRVLIRVHCGALFDAKGRQFSGTLTGILGLTGQVLSGGTFESWFLVG